MKRAFTRIRLVARCLPDQYYGLTYLFGIDPLASCAERNGCTADTVRAIRRVPLVRVLRFLSIRPCPEEEQVLEVAAAVERACRHPLAEAVVSAAEKGLPEKTPLDASGLRTVPGMGASAQVIREPVKVGLSCNTNVSYRYQESFHHP